MLARTRWLSLSLMVAFGLLVLLASACTPASSPIQAKVDMEGEPAVGIPFVLTLDVSSREPLTDVHALFSLPEGVEALGTTEWVIPELQPNEHKVFTATAQVTGDGYYIIGGSGVRKWFRDGQLVQQYGGGETLHVIVEGDDTWVSKRPPENTWKGTTALDVIPVQPELVDTSLNLADRLTADGPVEVVYTVTPRVDLANVTVGFAGTEGGIATDDAQVTTTGENHMAPYALSEEAKALAKTTRWEGSMAQGQTYIFRVTLHVSDNGERPLTAWVNERDPTNGQTIIGRADSLDLQFYVPRWARSWQYYLCELAVFMIDRLGIAS